MWVFYFFVFIKKLFEFVCFETFGVIRRMKFHQWKWYLPFLVSNGNETMILRVHFKRQSILKSVIGIYIFVIHTYNPFMRKYSFALKLYENVCLSRLSRKCSRLWKKICLKNFNSSIEFDANCMFFYVLQSLIWEKCCIRLGFFRSFLWIVIEIRGKRKLLYVEQCQFIYDLEMTFFHFI